MTNQIMKNPNLETFARDLAFFVNVNSKVIAELENIPDSQLELMVNEGGPYPKWYFAIIQEYLSLKERMRELGRRKEENELNPVTEENIKVEKEPIIPEGISITVLSLKDLEESYGIKANREEIKAEAKKKTQAIIDLEAKEEARKIEEEYDLRQKKIHEEMEREFKKAVQKKEEERRKAEESLKEPEVKEKPSPTVERIRKNKDLILNRGYCAEKSKRGFFSWLK